MLSGRGVSRKIVKGTAGFKYRKLTTRKTKSLPFEAIPGSKGLPLLGTLPEAYREGALSGGLHKYIEKRYREHGPIFRENLGGIRAVFIHDPGDIRELVQKEGKFPERVEFIPWKMHREISGRSLGLLLQDGEDWWRTRQPMNEHLMKRSSLSQHFAATYRVADDFLDILGRSRTNTGEVPNIRNLLFMWSIESGCLVIFGRRFGCLARSPRPAITEFVSAIKTMLVTSEKLMIFPPALARILRLPVWREHYSSWETIFKIGGEYVTPRLAEAKSSPDPQGLVAGMLRSRQIPDGIILASLIDLMVAAVDTTSSTCLWMLHLLAQNPQKQTRLRNELQSVTAPGCVPSPHHFNDHHYLKAAIKETLRLYPIAPFIGRVMQSDTTIRGYSVPKGTVVNMALTTNRHRGDLYSDPLTFKPERWLRGVEGDSVDPLASVPFGIGVRSCIGRRLAEMEIQHLISQVIGNYTIVPMSNRLPTEAMRIVLAPKSYEGLIFKPIY